MNESSNDESRTVVPTFRRAEARDVPELSLLVEQYYDFDGIPFDAASVRQGLAVLLGDESIGGAWLIGRGGQTVGYFVLTYGFDLEFGGRQATVTELFLRPEARSSGVGSAALEFVEQHLLTQRIFAYELQVERDNVAARAFYAARGFESHDRIPLSKRVGQPAGGPGTTRSGG